MTRWTDRFHKGDEVSQVQIAVDGTSQQQITRKAMEDAAADARHLMISSPVIPKLVAVDIIARQLFLHVRMATEAEIRGGWEVENPELVLQTLGLAAQEKAVNTPATAVQLRETILTTVLPILDIFCLMEQQRNEQQQHTNDTPTPVPGDDAGTPGELGTVPGRAVSDAEQQAGECRQGDPGKAGEEG